MADERFAERARDWLAGLAPGAEVRWNHDLARPAPGAHTGWIDVVAPDGCAATGTNWLVTIRAEDPDEGPADGVEVLEVTHDIAVRGRWEDHWFVDGTVEVLDGPAPDSLADGVRTRPAWSTAALHAALSAWAQRLAGRGDLVWVCDDDITSPLLAAAEATLAAIDAGDEDTFDLGDGIRIASGAFDTLLEAGPDTAAEVMAEFRSKLGI